jgi:predicted permease
MMLFRDLSQSEFSSMFDRKLVLYSVISTLTIFAASWLASLKLAGKAERGSFIQGCFRGNYAILGLPLVANILGDAQTGKAALITTFIIPLYNVLAIIALQAHGSGTAKATVRSTALGILKNPLVVGIALGVAVSALGISFPPFIASSLNSMGGLASPLALLAIGASIDAKEIKRKLKPSIMAAIIKLVAIPLIFVPIAAVFFNFRGESMVILYVMFAAPTAVSSFIMAESMGNDGPLAANIIMVTMIFSVVTFTFGVFLIKSAGLI